MIFLCSSVEPSVLFGQKVKGLLKTQQRFLCIIWVEMCWALRAGIAPTENACLEALIPSIHSTHDDIFLPTVLTLILLMWRIG